MALFPGWLTAKKAKQQQRNHERDAILGDAQDEMLEGPEITCLPGKFGGFVSEKSGLDAVMI